MRQTQVVTTAVLIAMVLVSAMCFSQAKGKGLDLGKTLVVKPFESTVKGAATLPEATRQAVIQMMKDEAVFSAVLTPEEAKDKEKPGLIELEAKLVDFAPGSAAKRLMVGFGSGRAHAGFEFTFKDAATGEILWQRTVKQTASFWFNSTTSSAAERSELPEGLAKKLIQEVKKQEKK